MHYPEDPWCLCAKCYNYPCKYCDADLNGWESPDGEEAICQECYMTKDSGDYDDWDYLEDSN